MRFLMNILQLPNEFKLHRIYQFHSLYSMSKHTQSTTQQSDHQNPNATAVSIRGTLNLSYSNIIHLERNFSNIPQLVTLEFPPLLESIANDNFMNCINLTAIVLPNSVTSLGKRCFMGCSSLAYIYLSTGLQEIPYGCFDSCAIKKISIPDSITKIAKCAFNACDSLRELILPDSIHSLGSCCFSGCDKLESVKLPKGLTRIPNECFYYCQSLETIELPSTLKSIGNYAFANDFLTRIVLPDGITHLGSHAFAENPGLTTINIPTSLKEMGHSCFVYCQYINRDTITLPTSLTSIGWNAFSHTGNNRKWKIYRERDLDDMDEIEDSDGDEMNRQPDSTELFLNDKLPELNWEYHYGEETLSDNEDPDEQEYGTSYSGIPTEQDMMEMEEYDRKFEEFFESIKSK